MKNSLDRSLKKCKVGEKLILHFLIYNTQNRENYQTLTDTLNFEVVFFSWLSYFFFKLFFS